MCTVCDIPEPTVYGALLTVYFVHSSPVGGKKTGFKHTHTHTRTHTYVQTHTHTKTLHQENKETMYICWIDIRASIVALDETIRRFPVQNEKRERENCWCEWRISKLRLITRLKQKQKSWELWISSAKRSHWCFYIFCFVFVEKCACVLEERLMGFWRTKKIAGMYPMPRKTL